jgi:uncharacterized pyridoxamine 5'-phosphate oxidase family protein
MKEVLDFLKEAGVFYFATMDEEQPMVRPFAFCMEFEGKLYFGTRETGNTSRQLRANPKFQVCAAAEKKGWIRITGKARFDASPEAMQAAAASRPDLLGRHAAPGVGAFKPALFYVEDGEAAFNTRPNGSRVVKF